VLILHKGETRVAHSEKNSSSMILMTFSKNRYAALTNPPENVVNYLLNQTRIKTVAVGKEILSVCDYLKKVPQKVLQKAIDTPPVQTTNVYNVSEEAAGAKTPALLIAPVNEVVQVQNAYVPIEDEYVELVKVHDQSAPQKPLYRVITRGDKQETLWERDPWYFESETSQMYKPPMGKVGYKLIPRQGLIEVVFENPITDSYVYGKEKLTSVQKKLLRQQKEAAAAKGKEQQPLEEEKKELPKTLPSGIKEVNLDVESKEYKALAVERFPHLGPGGQKLEKTFKVPGFSTQFVSVQAMAKRPKTPEVAVDKVVHKSKKFIERCPKLTISQIQDAEDEQVNQVYMNMSYLFSSMEMDSILGDMGDMQSWIRPRSSKKEEWTQSDIERDFISYYKELVKDLIPFFVRIMSAHRPRLLTLHTFMTYFNDKLHVDISWIKILPIY